MRVRRKHVDKINEISDDLMKLTNLSYESAKYDKMVINDVNNYAAKYDYGEIKYKGLFEIDKFLHKDNSMKIVPIALSKYFFENIPIEQTIENHKNIYDFCLRLKLNKGADGFHDYINNKGEISTNKMQKTTRYYISNRGGALYKIGTQHAKNPGRKTNVNVGYNSTIFNQYEDKDNYDINYRFYNIECKKIINSIECTQLSLFD